MKYCNYLIYFAILFGREVSGQSLLPPTDLRPESAIVRVKSRNLFHPTRGIIPNVKTSALEDSSEIPHLCGTVIFGKTRKAILRWLGQEESSEVESGKELRGFRVAKIQANRIEVQNINTGKITWIGLELPSAQGDQIDQHDEFTPLLSKNKSSATSNGQTEKKQ